MTIGICEGLVSPPGGGGGGGGGTPAALVQLAALYAQAVASGAVNTIPRFEDDQVRLPVAGVSEAWTVHRSADRYVEALVKTPDVASPTGTLVLWGLNSDCVGRVISSGSDWVWVRGTAGSPVVLGTHAAWRNKTIYISTYYDFSAQAYTHRVRAEGAAEATVAGTQARTVAGSPDYVALGGNVSGYVSTPGMIGIFAANYTADPGGAHRTAMYAAAGIA